MEMPLVLLQVKVGPRDASPVLKKTAERTGIGRGLDARNPVFDQSLDFLVDGDLADRSDTVVRVELWTMHMLLRPSYRGCVAVPLTRVIAASRLHDTFPLHDSESGRLEMTLEWLGTVDTL